MKGLLFALASWARGKTFYLPEDEVDQQGNAIPIATQTHQANHIPHEQVKSPHTMPVQDNTLDRFAFKPHIR
jgi:hypothetical protein